MDNIILYKYYTLKIACNFVNVNYYKTETELLKSIHILSEHKSRKKPYLQKLEWIKRQDKDKKKTYKVMKHC